MHGESSSWPHHWQADAWYLRALARSQTDPAGAVSDLSQATQRSERIEQHLEPFVTRCADFLVEAISRDPQEAEASLAMAAWSPGSPGASMCAQAWKLRAEIQLRRGGSLALEQKRDAVAILVQAGKYEEVVEDSSEAKKTEELSFFFRVSTSDWMLEAMRLNGASAEILSAASTEQSEQQKRISAESQFHFLARGACVVKLSIDEEPTKATWLTCLCTRPLF